MFILDDGIVLCSLFVVVRYPRLELKDLHFVHFFFCSRLFVVALYFRFQFKDLENFLVIEVIFQCS